MRKHQTLLVAGILLLASAGVAQAQAVYEAFGNAIMAREGGAGEKAGAIVLFLRSGTHNGGIVTIRYSAPLAAGTMAMASAGTPMTDVDEGTVTVTLPVGGEQTVTISDVRLDLREAAAPITATFSGNENAFVSGVTTVISAIEEALVVTSAKTQILTRGGMGTATVTIKEAFASAFTEEADILLTLVGVPDKASLMVSHVQPVDPAADADDADVAGDVTLNADTTIVANGDTAINKLSLTGDGDKTNITVGFAGDGPNAASTESLKLVFELTATSDQEGIMLPVDEGVVEVWVTMAPTTKPDPVGVDTEYFAVNYIPADGVVAFTIAPASCTLLFPYAVSTEMKYTGWNTGIAISNPSAFTDTPLSGTITFTLFPNDGEMIVHQTSAMSTGTGLDEEGSLPAGNTHTVLLSEVLDDAGMPGDFIGHLYVRTNFTGCRGVGWVTDFATVNQAYLPYFGDNLDEGSVPANNTKSVQ